MSTAIVWFRRDLRLADNPALQKAIERHDRVLPVFVWAPEEEAPWAPGAASRWWLHHSLAALGASLAALGAPLVLRTGPSLETLRALARAAGAEAVYWNRLYEPAITARDTRIKAALRDDGLVAESGNGALLVEPWELKTGAGDPYKVFTPFWRNAQTKIEAALLGGRQPSPAPDRLRAPEGKFSGVGLDSLELLPRIRWDQGFQAVWRPGEAGALQRLERFCDVAVGHYREARDFPAVAATSCLSPHLHFGEISPLQLLTRMRLLALDADAGERANAEWFVRELGWREFAHHLLWHFPHTSEAPLYDKFAGFAWRTPQDYAGDLRRWQRGQTGVPIVDAGLRQLWTTGWMHNRVRMLVASLLTKNLLVPWQEGARWFWDTLVDASLANNTLGWQWVAGCGADASPYFRIFNPATQSAKFDAQGRYLRHWVPELAGLSDDAIHAPWQHRIPAGYPEPVVDLGASREAALERYKRLR